VIGGTILLIVNIELLIRKKNLNIQNVVRFIFKEANRQFLAYILGRLTGDIDNPTKDICIFLRGFIFRGENFIFNLRFDDII
jgi:hypothetical protein